MRKDDVYTFLDELVEAMRGSTSGALSFGEFYGRVIWNVKHHAVGIRIPTKFLAGVEAIANNRWQRKNKIIGSLSKSALHYHELGGVMKLRLPFSAVVVLYLLTMYASASGQSGTERIAKVEAKVELTPVDQQVRSQSTNRPTAR
jgi:hypothetical protein